jgi:glycosyltransferase involved in cell wall biosynthesis
VKRTVDVTAAIAAIPPRVDNLLTEAINSVHAQTVMLRGGISVALDMNREGAARTRQRALDAVQTEWVAFLDDDDYWYPQHVETLLNLQRETDADFLYSWFDGNNPFPMHRGRQFDAKEPHHTTMNVMVRTQVAKEAGGFLLPDGPLHQDWAGEDWKFITRCANAGAKFAGSPEITWHYRIHGRNTSGLPRW